MVEAEFDPSRLTRMSFSSRKEPEYMHYRLVECAACDALYASPAPRERHLARAYREADYEATEEAGFAARTYARLLRPILARLPERGAALDIGAGDGAFVEYLLDAGFAEVVGVEPSRAPILAASERVRPMIREGVFKADDFEPDHFHLITCFQTLEYLHDPDEVLWTFPSLLAPGGVVLVC